MDILHSPRSRRSDISHRCTTSALRHRERPRRRRTHLVATVFTLRLLPLCRRQIAALSNRHSEPQRLQQLTAPLHCLGAHPQLSGDRLVRRGHAAARRLIRGRAIRVRDAQKRVRRHLRRPSRRLTLGCAQDVHHGVEPRGRAGPCRHRPIGTLGRRQYPTARSCASLLGCCVRHAGRAGCTYGAICADSGYYEATSYRPLVGTTKLRFPTGSS